MSRKHCHLKRNVLQTSPNPYKNLEIVLATTALFTLCKPILERYNHLKKQKGFLDYDDLILKTHALLQSSGRWVNYKLDQGLDHILVDEAQDTNPEQWQIIDALCDDFFTGENAAHIYRTLFVVGDEKQSIYSFQRASPEEFAKMQKKFEKRVTDAGQTWRKVDLDISFRSTPAVLQSVDTVFEDPSIYKGVSQTPISHSAFRRGQAGHVELWPCAQAPETEIQSLWTPPVEITQTQSAQQILAENIARKIDEMIGSDILQSYDRATEPKDFMILVKTRNAFTEHLIRSLKNKNIPVSGADRLTLTNHIAVQDMIALLKFTQSPEDDLNLACLLKSPLIGIDEDTLFELAYNRENTLWESLKNKGEEAITQFLQSALTQGRSKSTL